LLFDPARRAEIASLDRARLAEVPFPLLLLAHHAAGTSGVLVARRGKVEKRVLLAGGAPVDCRSNLVHETLSRFLVAIGRITPAEETQALSRSIAEGKLFGQVLREQGKLDDAELHRLLQQSLAKKLLDLFTWRDGEIALEAAAPETASDLRVKVPQLVLTGVTRFLPREGLERAIAPLARAPLARGELPPEREALRLGDRERAVLAALDRPRRFEELLVSPAGKPAEMARSVLALAMLGGVVPAPEPEAVAAAAPPAEPSPAPAAAPAPAPPPPRPASIVASLTDLDEIRRAYAAFRERDPFELLGVDEVASSREVDERFVAFARRFAPWPWSEAGQPDVAARVAELFLAGATAYARLRDPDAFEGLLRARRERRAAAGPAPTAATASPAAPSATPPARAHSLRIETDLLDADVQFRKGLAFKRAGKLDLAQQQLDFAADCDAQNGLYLAEAAHCRFLLAPATQAARSFDELLDAQRVDPACSEAYLYAGEVAAAQGRLEAAEEQYRQAAKRLGPSDRRALDALAELGQRRRKKR
jgi:tetratricopeptide (TPR) repeat protein